MAVFNGHTVTKQGNDLLARALAGEGKFLFTRAAFGEGKYSGDVRELTDLVDKRLDSVISSVVNDRGTAIVKVQITNKDLQTSFRTEEFGIFAKIEGDSQDVLYCYASAVESDAIPNNSLGQTFEAENNVYITLSSDTEAEIYIKEGTIFLTLEVANQQYVPTGAKIRGALAGRNSLEENGQYQGNDGNWYLNIGGARSWNSSGTPDENLKQISFLQHEKDLNKKQDKDVPDLPTTSKNIVGSIKEIFRELWVKASTKNLGRVKIGDGLEVDTEGVVSHQTGEGHEHIPSGGVANQFLKFLATGKANWFTPAKLKLKFGNNVLGEYIVTNQDTEIDLKNNKVGFLERGDLPAVIQDANGIYKLLENKSGLSFDSALLYLNDAGTKTQGKIYFDKNKKGMFKCIKTTSGVVNSTEFFVDINNNAISDKLENLISINGINQNLEIKFSTASMKEGVQEQQINFETPFKNKCFGVLCADDGVQGEYDRRIRTIVTDSDTISRYGFTALTTPNTYIYQFVYLAIGY